jgi:arginase
MNVRVITVPYDSGHTEERMGRGPGHLIERGLMGVLEAGGHVAALERIEADAQFTLEVKTSFGLYRRLAERVRLARTEGSFPIVLAGNCASCLGTVSGVGPVETGVVWFDAHGDFNTPETTLSGFFDGMALATLTGRCWRSLAATVPGFRPVPEANVIQVGAHDFDREEDKLLESSGITRVMRASIEQAGVRGALGPALDELGKRVRRVYLHLDLDVLDPAEAVVNEYSTPGGLMVKQVEEAISLVAERFEICACAITAYDPAYDEEGRASVAALAFAELVSRLASAGK